MKKASYEMPPRTLILQSNIQHLTPLAFEIPTPFSTSIYKHNKQEEDALTLTLAPMWLLHVRTI